MSLRRLTSLVTTCTAGLALTLGGAPAASAATRSTSSNWAGYAVTKTGTAFRHVSGTWVQPPVDCSQGGRTYSSVWVGIGGYRGTSTALEQIGTEADCTPAGRAVYSTWYELVPDISHSARIALAAGDRLHAGVAVSGTRTTMTIKNLTRGTSFTRTLRASAVDVTSAEWIVEAPSLCSGGGQCATGALAAFGTTTFTGAQAVSRTGHAGAIGDAAWTAHAIDLSSSSGRRFAEARAGGSGGGSGGAATTGDLDATGASFAVTYAGTVSGSDPGGTGQGPFGSPRR